MTITPLTDEQAHDGLLQEYSDAYKASMGFRPSLATAIKLGNMELYDAIHTLYDEVDAFDAMEAEARAYEADIAKNGIGPFVEGPLSAALREAL